MSQNKSRMKRNEWLHQQLINEKEEKIQTKELSPFAQKLNEIDAQFEPMDVEYEPEIEEASPLHLRNERFSLKKEVEIQEESKPKEADFSNDYLEQFINEAKEYNMEKGYRKEIDTKANVLSNIEGWQTHVRPFGDAPEQIRPSKTQELNEIDYSSDTALHLEDLMNEYEADEEHEVDDQETIMLEVRRLSEMKMEEPEIPIHDTDETITLVKEEILSQEQEEISNEENSIQEVIEKKEAKASTSETIINFLLYVLVGASLVVVLIIIYILLRVNNII